jgi:uncharacterized repeat protein (TIGR01451 family)
MHRSWNRLTTSFLLVLIAIPPTAGSADEATGAVVPLTFEQRVACVEKVEDVYWSHRIWPDANSGPKPLRHEVVPRSQIAAMVERSLLQEAALEHLTGEPLAPRHIQRELDRIAAGTKNHALLRDVFHALGNDATLIAECYVRPRLVERLLHQSYAWHSELHHDARIQARDELSGVGFITDLGTTSAEVTKATWIRADAYIGDRVSTDEIVLDHEEWNAEIRRLAGRFPPESPGEPTSHVPVDPAELVHHRAGQGVSPMFETDHGFSVVEIVEATDGRLSVASATWPKRGIADWLTSIGDRIVPADPQPGLYVHPEIKAGRNCTDDTWAPTAGSGSPSGRKYHSMVWTGTEVIVWGGFDNTVLGDGGRYDPATDTWAPMASTGAPAARYGAASVWNGTEMIIWGGYPYSSTGGRYDPVTDSWTSTSTVNAPSARTYVAGIWAGTEMIIWGGYNYTNTGGRYDPSTDTWTTMTTTGAPSAREQNAVVWTGSELIVWGGSDGSLLDTGGRYDPSTDSWTPTTTVGAPPASYRLSSVWTGSEMIVWGGDPYGTPRDTGGRYDPATDTWAATSTVDVPLARGDHTAIWTGTEMVVWGGTNMFDELNTGGRYDPATDTWTATSLTGAPIRRTVPGAVWTGSEMIVWGGGTPGPTNTGARYDPTTDTWVAMTPNNLSHRFYHTAVWTGAEMIVWGGRDNTPNTESGSRYDPATDSWLATSTVDAPSPRTYHSAVWTGTAMVIWGGLADPFAHLQTGGRYDPATDSWTATSTTGAPAARYQHSAVWTGTEMIVWTGSVNGASSQTGGRYDPAADTWVSTATTGAPSSIIETVAVWSGSEMLVWGGYPTSGIGARYDPVANSWSPISSAGAPEARQYHTGVWTGAEFIVWGGINGGTNLGTGGRYDPPTDTWAPTSEVSAPSPRRLPGSVWTGSEFIVWSGYDQSGRPVTGGRYDPATDSWTPTSTTDVPAGRYGHTSVWTGTEMIVWGGDTGSFRTDTGGRYCAVGVPDLDFGDVPDPTYPTLVASNGARHVIDGVTYLGAGVDADPDGQPSLHANGDDNDAQGDDEDGISFITWPVAGQLCTIRVTASTVGMVSGWIDFNADGDWADAGEQIFTDVAVTAGVNNLDYAIPITAATGVDTYARFRFSTTGGLSFEGLASDGEVEDYKMGIFALDFGDAPDPTYPTLDAGDGARHIIAGGLHLGASVDHEADGHPSALADGDDLDGADDEDGVVFASGLGRGLDASLEVTASAAGLLNAFVDFNADGDWTDPGEQVFTDRALVAGTNSLSFAVPSGATLGTTFARFRLDTVGGLSPSGYATDGEVEDYLVEIVEGPDLAIEMTASSEPVPSGYPLTYTLTVTNNGPLPATSVTVTDTLPGDLIFVSSTPGAPGCTFAAGTLSCDLGAMAPIDTAEITVETVLDHPVWGSLSNTASVSATETDPLTANNTATVDTRIALFVDGFENGTTDPWSATVP